MPGRWTATGRILPYAGLLLLAAAGQLTFNQAVATIGRSQGKPWSILTPGFDFYPIWWPNYLFFHGPQQPQWYGAGISNAWPPPHEVLLAPFGLLSYDAAHVVSVVLCAALMFGTIALWIRWSPQDPSSGSAPGWALLLSAAVFSVIWIDQLQAALGLAALSLALWAQRKEKWWLVGVASAIGTIRVLNAIPILCLLLLGGWGKWRQMAVALGSAATFMAPLLFISYLRDHQFVGDYLASLSAYPANGAPKVVIHSFGLWGVGLLLAAASAVALWLLRKDVGRPLDPARSAMGMALTVVVAPVGGLYPAIYALPALIRLGQRRGFTAIPWIGAAGPWLLILLLSPWLLSSQPGLPLTFVSFADYGLVLLAYPILRNPPEAVLAKAT